MKEGLSLETEVLRPATVYGSSKLQLLGACVAGKDGGDCARCPWKPGDKR